MNRRRLVRAALALSLPAILSCPSPAYPSTVPLQCNFQGDDCGFSVGQIAGTAGWARTNVCKANADATVHSAPTAFRFGNPSTCDYTGDGARQAGTLTSPPITLSAAAGLVTLSFSYLAELASPGQIDEGSVLVSDDEFATSTVLASTTCEKYPNAGSCQVLLNDFDAPLWHRTSVDVSGFAGRTVRVRFLVDGGGSERAGFYVDDIGVRVNIPPTADGSATSLVRECSNVALDGSASTDIDGQVRVYEWAQTGGALTVQDFSLTSGGFAVFQVGGSAGWARTNVCKANADATVHSAPTAFRFGNPSTCDYTGDGARQAGTLTSPPITLSAAAGLVTLSFSYLAELASPGQIDEGSVLVSDDEFATSTVLASTTCEKYPNAGSCQVLLNDFDAPLWHRTSVDVSGFAGRTVRVRFLVDGGGSARAGFYVDDVGIQTDRLVTIAASRSAVASFTAPCSPGTLTFQLITKDDGFGGGERALESPPEYVTVAVASCFGDTDCNDANSCTLDSCGVDHACHHSPVPGTCNDGRFCTVNDRCQEGTCTGDPRDCTASGNQCNVGVCDDAHATCVTSPVADATTCDDGRFCTTADTCQTGVCTPGPERDCDDGDTCTDDACGQSDTCTHATTPPTQKAGVVCSVRNLRSILNERNACVGACPTTLAMKLKAIEKLINVGASAQRRGKCLHKLGMAAKTANGLGSQIRRLGSKGKIRPAERVGRLADEASRLAASASTLAGAICSNL